MNRDLYFNYIEEKLHVLARRIETKGKLNLLTLHVHSENFYLHLFNILFELKLSNLNSKLQNVEAIDLIDHTNKIIVQVSATCTKQKIESALNKPILDSYRDYSFKFISISKDASELRKRTFKNPYSLIFIPDSDIFDIVSILGDIMNQQSHKIKELYSFIKDELGTEVDIVKLDSNLAEVINILSQETWDDSNKSEAINSFEIDRKILFNELNNSKYLIKEYCIFYSKVDEKYSEYDALGVNKSNSVLATIKREYLKSKNISDSDLLFITVAEKLKDKIIESPNFIIIPIDELELCVDILVVDAFIRCKIFENPQNYNYATTRQYTP